MTDKATIEKIIDDYIRGTDIFPVDITVNPGNVIHITLDKPEGITLKECTGINNHVTSLLDKDAEDFELEVSSPGLGLPFKVFQQYLKNIGRDVEVVLKDGLKIKGKLVGASPERIEIEEQKKVRKEGKKKPEQVIVINSFFVHEVKSTKLIISFK